MKNKIFGMAMLAIALIFGFIFTGCNNDDEDVITSLATPSSVILINGTLSWQLVDNAQGYTVYINGAEYQNVSGTIMSLAIPKANWGSALTVQAYNGKTSSQMSNVAFVLDNNAGLASVGRAGSPGTTGQYIPTGLFPWVISGNLAQN